jgi:transposase
MLVEDTTASRKQRHAARRILARLIEEHGGEELSYSTVRDYVRVRRAQIDVEAGRRVEVFVPQEHAPGAEAEVDFGQVYVVLDGVKTKCHMFIFRLSHSGKAIHRIYPTQAQEAFLEDHVEAFNEIGGVPVKHIRYDNLTSAVRALVFGQGRNRLETTGGCCSVRSMDLMPFIVSQVLPALTRKAGSRARWAGSAATGLPRCP